MQKMTVCITEADIQENERYRLNNPIVYVLQRLTGTLWQLDENGLLAEAMRPFRACQLSREVMDVYRHYKRTGKMKPLQFEIEFHYEVPGSELFAAGRDSSVYTASITEKSSGTANTTESTVFKRL